MKTAREYWNSRFGEYPQNDNEKLAVVMMREYAEEFYKSKLAEISDEDIEKMYPTDLAVLCDIHKIPRNFNAEQGDFISDQSYYNLLKQRGAKAFKNGLIKHT